MAKQGEIVEEIRGPYRGVTAREYAAIKGQFRHLMNCLCADAGVFGRFGTEHEGQAASIKSTLQTLSTLTGFHDECDHKVVRHMTIQWHDPTPEYVYLGVTYSFPKNTVARFIWSNIPQASYPSAAGGICWMQLQNVEGDWITFISFLESCPDDPNVQTVMLNGAQYFCTGYGPLYRIEQYKSGGYNLFRIREAVGVDRHPETGGLIPYITGALPHPIALAVVKGNVLAFLGIRNGNDLLTFSTGLPAPTLETPAKRFGGSLTVGTTYYFRVTMVDDYGMESAGSNEVSKLVSAAEEVSGLSAWVKDSRSFMIKWQSVPHGAKYRVYVGTAPDVYFDWFETTEQIFHYSGQAGSGVRKCPTISGPWQTQFGKNAHRTVCFFDPQTVTDGKELALKGENFLQLPSDKTEDVNDPLVGGGEAFGGLVAYTQRSITFCPLGGVIDPAINPFEPQNLAQGMGLASTRARVNVRGREYFIDGCGKGIFMLPGPQTPVEVSTSWSQYFEGVSQSGIDPFNCVDTLLKYAHCVDEAKAGLILFWLPMGLPNSRTIPTPTEFCAIYKYDNIIPQREKDSTDWWAFAGKGAYYDPWGWVNVIERGFAFASADYLDDGYGNKRLWLGGYDGYSSTQSVNFTDAAQEPKVLSASSTTKIRLDLNAYPGLKQHNDHVGAWMEVIDNLASGTIPPGTVVNDQRRYITAVDDVYWNNCDIAWSASAGGTDPQVFTTDGIDNRGCVRVTIGAGAAVPNTLIAYSPVASTNLAAGTVIRLWLKVSRIGAFTAMGYPAGTLQLVLDDTAGCVSPLVAYDIPELLANKWTECSFVVAAPLAGVISIGIRSGNPIVPAAGDYLFIDQVDNNAARYVDITIASAFVDPVGTAVSLTVGMGVRIYWDINARGAIVPLGITTPADAEIFWQSLTALYKCAGEQGVRFMYSAHPDGFDPVMLVTSMPRTDTPQYSTTGYAPSTIPAPGLPVGTPVLPPNHLPDGALALVENLYSYWSWSNLPGRNDVRAETLWFSGQCYGRAMHVMFECHDRHQFAFYSYVGRGKLQRIKGK